MVARGLTHSGVAVAGDVIIVERVKVSEYRGKLQGGSCYSSAVHVVCRDNEVLPPSGMLARHNGWPAPARAVLDWAQRNYAPLMESAAAVRPRAVSSSS